jgi:transcriptional regulator GlxA family with amidase domain
LQVFAVPLPGANDVPFSQTVSQAGIMETAPQPSRVTHSHRQVVSCVEEFLRAHLDEPVQISELCSLTGVSERSLRNACHAVCGTSPKRLLTRRRMEAVRHALETARPGHDTVTRIATRYGFYELGRFAATYSSLFGERPSQTLRSSAAGIITTA